LTNLSEDPLLSGKVLHSLSREKIRVGKKNGNPQPEIILGGLGIKPNHAYFVNEEGTISLYPEDVFLNLMFSPFRMNVVKVFSSTETKFLNPESYSIMIESSLVPARSMSSKTLEKKKNPHIMISSKMLKSIGNSLKESCWMLKIRKIKQRSKKRKRKEKKKVK
jgi:hypothetical protein